MFGKLKMKKYILAFIVFYVKLSFQDHYSLVELLNKKHYEKRIKPDAEKGKHSFYDFTRSLFKKYIELL